MSYFKPTIYNREPQKGFTLVEMIVAVSIFTMIMLMAIGALLSIIDASRKSTNLQSSFINLDFAFESMSRSIRVGSRFRCIPGSYSSINIDTTQDCAGGGSAFAFEPFGGSPTNPADQWVFRLNGTQIERSIQGGGLTTFVPVTSPDVIVQGLQFYVIGTTAGDTNQPLLLITAWGYAGSNLKTRVTFNLQTTVSQRVLDI